MQDEEEWAENCTLGNTSEIAEPAGDYPLFIVLLRGEVQNLWCQIKTVDGLECRMQDEVVQFIGIGGTVSAGLILAHQGYGEVAVGA